MCVSRSVGRWFWQQEDPGSRLNPLPSFPPTPSVLALIGRNMLAHCQFIYDGLKGELLLIC